jgi:hypothetical protein
MRDISWLILHFNARAFIQDYPADPKWIGVYGANGCIDPYGDRGSNIRDIQMAVIHFGHKMNTTTP